MEVRQTVWGTMREDGGAKGDSSVLHGRACGPRAAGIALAEPTALSAEASFVYSL